MLIQFKDCKVISGQSVVTQHRMLVVDMKREVLWFYLSFYNKYILNRMTKQTIK